MRDNTQSEPKIHGGRWKKGQSGNPAPKTMWRKGQTGNPGGRPRGLAAFIRQTTGGGWKLVRFMVAVFSGGPVSFPDPRQPGVKVTVIPTLMQRIDAATWLADRGFGRPVQPIEGDVRPPFIIALRQPIQVDGRRVVEGQSGPAPPPEPKEELLTFEPPPKEW